MGLLDFLRGRKTDELPPGAGIGPGTFTVDVNTLGHRATYPTLSAHGGGLDGWAPRYGVNTQTLQQQDERLTPTAEPPTNAIHNGRYPSDEYWAQRNDSRLRRGYVEKLQGGTGWPVLSYENEEAPNPVFYGPPPPSRPTAYLSPSNYRFLAPMRSGRGDVQPLNGQHFSMASMHRSYPIRGMTPRTDWRNTYRIEPPPRDAGNLDRPGESATVPNMEYTSPVASSSAGRSFRLV